MASSLSFLLLGSHVVRDAPGQQKGRDEHCFRRAHVALSSPACGQRGLPPSLLFSIRFSVSLGTEGPGKGSKPIREKIFEVSVMKCVPCRLEQGGRGKGKLC